MPADKLERIVGLAIAQQCVRIVVDQCAVLGKYLQRRLINAKRIAGLPRGKLDARSQGFDHGARSRYFTFDTYRRAEMVVLERLIYLGGLQAVVETRQLLIRALVVSCPQ